MEIKVLGPGCANCKRLYQEAEKAVAESIARSVDGVTSVKNEISVRPAA